MDDFCAGMHNAGLLEVRCLSRPWLVLVVGGAVDVVLCLKVRHVQARLVFRLGYAILCSNI